MGEVVQSDDNAEAGGSSIATDQRSDAHRHQPRGRGNRPRRGGGRSEGIGGRGKQKHRYAADIENSPAADPGPSDLHATDIAAQAALAPAEEPVMSMAVKPCVEDGWD